MDTMGFPTEGLGPGTHRLSHQQHEAHDIGLTHLTRSGQVPAIYLGEPNLFNVPHVQKSVAAIHTPSSQLSACHCLLSMSPNRELLLSLPPLPLQYLQGKEHKVPWDKLQAGTPQPPRRVCPKQEELHPIKPVSPSQFPPQGFHIRTHRPQQALRGLPHLAPEELGSLYQCCWGPEGRGPQPRGPGGEHLCGHQGSELGSHRKPEQVSWAHEAGRWHRYMLPLVHKLRGHFGRARRTRPWGLNPACRGVPLTVL